jgi:hypothetical protein
MTDEMMLWHGAKIAMQFIHRFRKKSVNFVNLIFLIIKNVFLSPKHVA